MNLTTPAPTASEVAEEAGFQLLVAKNYLEWIEAVSRAIEGTLQHDDGRDAAKLAELAKHLSCDALPGLEIAIDQFNKIAETKHATQNAKSENVSRNLEKPQ